MSEFTFYKLIIVDYVNNMKLPVAKILATFMGNFDQKSN